MKITQQELEGIIKEEISAIIEEGFRMRDMVPPKVRGKFKDTFTKIPNPDLEKRSAERNLTLKKKLHGKPPAARLVFLTSQR